MNDEMKSRQRMCGCYPGHPCRMHNGHSRQPESEVRAALAPRGHSPELEEAERSLALCVESVRKGRPELYLNRKHSVPIADELARLRAENDRLLRKIEELSSELDADRERFGETVRHANSEIEALRAEVARLSQPAPAQPDDDETAARCRLKNALIATVNGPNHADFTRYQEALENLIGVVRGSAPAQDRSLCEFTRGSGQEVERCLLLSSHKGRHAYQLRELTQADVDELRMAAVSGRLLAAQDRATRVKALQEHLFRRGWSVGKEVCDASLDFCDKDGK